MLDSKLVSVKTAFEEKKILSIIQVMLASVHVLERREGLEGSTPWSDS